MGEVSQTDLLLCFLSCCVSGYSVTFPPVSFFLHIAFFDIFNHCSGSISAKSLIWQCLVHWLICAQNGDTPLMKAAENNHVDCMRLLLDAGASIEAQNDVRFVVLFEARGCVCCVCVKPRICRRICLSFVYCAPMLLLWHSSSVFFLVILVRP